MSTIRRKTIRQGDDFKVTITFRDREGVALDQTTQSFKFIYRDIYGATYEISYDGITRKNCYVKDGHLVGVFENYELACCILKREAYYWASDDVFSDGQWNYGSTVMSGIELTREGGVCDVEEMVEVLEDLCINETLVLSKGDKGDKGDSITIVQNPGMSTVTVMSQKACTNAFESKYVGSALTPLFVSRGAVYNASTGFYELNELTDITEAQMVDIYNLTSSQLTGTNWDEKCLYANCRTNFMSNATGRYMGPVTTIATFAGAKMEHIIVSQNNTSLSTSNLSSMFRSNSKLRRVLGVLTGGAPNHDAFEGCGALEDISIIDLKLSISFSGSPLLTRESILYMINNAANTTPITVTLHTTAFLRLTEADIALASRKNITLTSV